MRQSVLRRGKKFHRAMGTRRTRAAALALRTSALLAAAFRARALRCSGVRAAILDLPPARPPFFPIADMTAVISFLSMFQDTAARSLLLLTS